MLNFDFFIYNSKKTNLEHFNDNKTIQSSDS